METTVLKFLDDNVYDEMAIIKKFEESYKHLSDVKKQDVKDIFEKIGICYDKSIENSNKQYNNIATSFSSLSDVELNYFYMLYQIEKYKSTDIPCVYFIKNEYTGLIKIGKTKHVIARFKQLLSMFKNHFGVNNGLKIIGIIPIFDGSEYKIETYLHKKYNDYRTFGEWFDIDFDLIIKECFDSYHNCGGIIIGNIGLTNYGLRTMSKERFIPNINDIQKYFVLDVFKNSGSIYDFFAYGLYKTKNIILPPKYYDYKDNDSVEILGFYKWLCQNYTLEDIQSDDYDVDIAVICLCINTLNKHKAS